MLDLGDDLGLAVELFDAEVLPELVEQGQVRDRLPERDALALEPRDGLARLGELAASPEMETTWPRPALTSPKRSMRVATS